MSSQSQPIDPARFALAIEELPVEQIYAKAAELHNQIFHLEKSNEQLRGFADDGDEDCAEALLENMEVVNRINTRLELLRLEVERRGMVWSDHGENRPATAQPLAATQEEAAHESDTAFVNGGGTSATAATNGDDPTHGRRQGGRLNDEQLSALMRARLAEEFGDDEGGIDL